MKCPRCGYCKPTVRKPNASLPFAETAPGQIFPQRCWDCGRNIAPGESALAYRTMPLAVCLACAEKPRRDGPVLRDLSRYVLATVEGGPTHKASPVLEEVEWI